MRQGLTIVPAGLVLAVALLGAGGGPGTPPAGGSGWLDDRFGQRIAPIYLLLRPDVQGDLQLNPHQIAGARDLVATLIERLLSLKGKPEQTIKKERWEIDEAMAAWLRHELSEAQLERLTQISFQWEGVAALRRPSVIEYLGIVEAQQARIRVLLDDRDRRHASGTLAPAEFERISREALGVLNALQKQQWDGLLGPPCRFVVGAPAAPPTRTAADGPELKG